MKPPSHTRMITPVEIRYLRAQKSSLQRSMHMNWSKILLTYGIICSGLAGITWLVTDDVPVWASFTIWGCAFVSLLGWTVIESRITLGRLRHMVSRYDTALTAAQCVDTPIKSTRMWEFEEFEDEGASYAFELETGGVVFIVGQEFYSERRFPNTDFSLVEFHSTDGRLLDFLIAKRGGKLAPERLIRTSEHDAGNKPVHLDFCTGTLEEVCAKFIRS